MLRNPKPQLSIDVDVVIPGEDIGGGQLRLRQTHHLSETRPGIAIEVRHALGCYDRDVTRTLDHDRTAVKASITDPIALVRRQVISALYHAIDGNRHSS